LESSKRTFVSQYTKSTATGVGETAFSIDAISILLEGSAYLVGWGACRVVGWVVGPEYCVNAALAEQAGR